MKKSRIIIFRNRVSVYLDYIKIHFFKLTKIPVEKKIRLQGYQVYFGDIRSLDMLFKEIFLKNTYACHIGEQSLIIDGGANIGMAVLYFKKVYPDSRVIAFEPNPSGFELLQKNVSVNKLKNVEIHHAALDSEEGVISFFLSSNMNSGDIGASTKKIHVDCFHAEKGSTTQLDVPSKKLSSFLKEEVGLLKIDIEGSESNVMQEISQDFQRVQNLILEYHYHAGYNKNLLSNILSVIEIHEHAYVIEGKKKLKFKENRNFIIKSKKII